MALPRIFNYERAVSRTLFRRSEPGFYELLGLFYKKVKILTLDMAAARAYEPLSEDDDDNKKLTPVHTILFGPNVKPPKRRKIDSAGYEVFCPETVTIKPHHSARINLGFSMSYPAKHFALVKELTEIADKGLIVMDGVNESRKYTFLFSHSLFVSHFMVYVS